jgi:LacI family transcriptional regulator
VAAVAGTSVATASRALNGTGYVAEDTRARVLDAARQLQYQPNLRARGLRQRRSRSIGLIVPSLLNAYYTALADSISQLLAARGYHLLLSSTRDDAGTEQDTLYDMVGQAVDGLIWVPTSPGSDLLSFLRSQNVPLTAIVRRIPEDPVDTVVFEDYAGSRAATQHLISLGHRQIAFVGGDIEYSSNRERLRGYRDAMREAGLPGPESAIKVGTTRSTWGIMATKDLLREPEPPTALFVASNAIMPGVMRALRQREVRLPEDLSLICFDDIDWFSFSVPPITAIRTAHNRLAEAAVDLLFRRIQVPEDVNRGPAYVEINFELVLRESTAAVRRGAPLLKPEDTGEARPVA